MKAEKYGKMSKLLYPLYNIIHPIDGFQEMKYNRKDSLPIALLILLLWFFSSVIGWKYTGFDFNVFRADRLNILLVLAKTILLFGLLAVSNWAFCTLMDGKGNFREICIYGAYAAVPFIFISLIVTVFSRILTLEEGILLTYLRVIGLIWTAVLLITALVVLHEYTIKKAVYSIALSILGVLIILFFMLLVYTLIQQLIYFIFGVGYEILYKFTGG